MKTVALISCTKSKRTEECEARLLYDKSPKFNKSLEFAQTQADEIFILSAKYGLVSLNTHLKPYNKTLVGKRKNEKSAWGKKVLRQITELFDVNTTMFIILAGADYFAPLQNYLPHKQIPLLGLRQGESLARLNELLNKNPIRRPAQ